MIVTMLDDSEVYCLEPETAEEVEFLETCPVEWSWDRVWMAYTEKRQ